MVGVHSSSGSIAMPWRIDLRIPPFTQLEETLNSPFYERMARVYNSPANAFESTDGSSASPINRPHLPGKISYGRWLTRASVRVSGPGAFC